LQLEFQFLEQVLVAADGGDEIGERVLQARQSDKAFVVHLVVEIVLGLLDEGVDLLESFQIPHRAGEEQSEGHIHIVGESLAALLLKAHEVDHHVRLVEAHRDGHVALVDDAQGHGGIGCAASYLLDVGDTEDDEHPSVVVLIAGTLVGIAHVAEKIVGYVEPFNQLSLVFICGAGNLNPAVGLPFGD